MAKVMLMTSDRIEKLLAEVRGAMAFAKKMTPAHDGLLFTRKSGNGTVRYYKRESGDTCGEYLGKNCQKTIKVLEEKNYYSKLLKTATEEEHQLVSIREKLKTLVDYKSVFLSIPLEKRHLIRPYEYSPEEKDDEVVRIFNKKPVKEEQKLVTQNGEHVRSKSELIIADRLRAADIPYYYEDPLILADENKSKEAITSCLYWHPDFRVLNKRTRKQYYWEHFGMLDNPEYCKSCQSKLEVYAKYGYFPGENLIVTSESSEHSLNLEYVDCLIEKYLK